MEDGFEDVRVVDEPTAIKIVGVSPRTWDRMRARGELPPKTRLSDYRVGYRLVDLKQWLDARRSADTIVCRASRRRKVSRRRKSTGETATA